ncbi:NAD(P)H-dependent glycerol-3-phosphate dehydrogenase [Ornithobacterium rhinotracheale]|uniref:NAD(P)H-dependent glycerol-3-phosphate dehydrogenase n=1 Tax=Ornithobacterium rhinotracheale TaxID=28251 RepID=UPI001FF2E1A0|nr:NAD(P)H-dependent glycerol-3-phosphate dehydrogenase [Ornithobacterium rhinotracheale]MCK0204556.1 NAD(P)-binding domain-containing protein [Ornithobacterium rhinotracheale]
METFTSNLRVGVLGSGSFATAIVKILCENLPKVNWCVRNATVRNYIQQECRNPNYLSSVEFNAEKLRVTTSINQLVRNSDVVLLVIPSIYLLDALKDLKVSLKDKIVVTAIKGLIPQKCQIITDYLKEELKVPEENIGVIAGPCHAEEIALERLSYITVGFSDPRKAYIAKRILTCDYVNVSASEDIYGIEHAAVIKNMFAIAAGIAHGLGYGDNFQAVLMSNSIREMKKYLKKISPVKRNINDSVYLGDLLVTGYSYFSRNRMLGTMIGKGYTVKSALMEMNMVPEGYYATEGIRQIAEANDLKMPILKAVYKILYQDKMPKKQFEKLTKKLD